MPFTQVLCTCILCFQLNFLFEGKICTWMRIPERKKTQLLSRCEHQKVSVSLAVTSLQLVKMTQNISGNFKNEQLVALVDKVVSRIFHNIIEQIKITASFDLSPVHSWKNCIYRLKTDSQGPGLASHAGVILGEAAHQLGYEKRTEEMLFVQRIAYKSGWLRGTRHALLCGPAPVLRYLFSSDPNQGNMLVCWWLVHWC